MSPRKCPEIGSGLFLEFAYEENSRRLFESDASTTTGTCPERPDEGWCLSVAWSRLFLMISSSSFRRRTCKYSRVVFSCVARTTRKHKWSSSSSICMAAIFLLRYLYSFGVRHFFLLYSHSAIFLDVLPGRLAGKVLVQLSETFWPQL